MSKPSKISQVAIGTVAASSGSQSVLADANSRIKALGTRGALVAGGPVLPGKMLKSTTIAAQTITADQLVGGHISVASGGGANTFTMPTAAQIYLYLTREMYATDGDPTTNVSATTPLTSRSIPITTFQCVFAVGSGSTLTLDYGAGTGIEFYANGPANAVAGGTTLVIPETVQVTYEFIAIQATNTLSPRIGFYPVAFVTLGGATGIPSWAQTLAIGRYSGPNNPIINDGYQIVYFGGLAIGSNFNAANTFGNFAISIGGSSNAQTFGTAVGYGSTAVANQASSFGYSATVLPGGVNGTALGTLTNVAFNQSTAIGYMATATAANQIMMGTATETVTIPGKGTMVDTALATTNTFSLNYLAGIPSGAAANGSVVIDGVDNRLYIRMGGTWRFLFVPAVGVPTWSDTLGLGNHSGPYNPIIDTGQYILFDDAISIGGWGDPATVAASTSIAIGGLANAADHGLAIGYGTNAAGLNSTALGTSSYTNIAASNAVALGYGSGAKNQFSTAIGPNTTTAFDYSTAIGANTSTTAAHQIMLGTNLDTVAFPKDALFLSGLTIGSNNNAATSGGATSITIGGLASTSTQSVSVGYGVTGGGAQGTAVGYGAFIGAVANGTALGYSSNVGATLGVALGVGATIGASGAQGTALGCNTSVNHSASTAIGYGATTTGPNQIMLGVNQLIWHPWDATFRRHIGAGPGPVPVCTATSGSAPVPAAVTIVGSDTAGYCYFTAGVGVWTVTINFGVAFGALLIDYPIITLTPCNSDTAGTQFYLSFFSGPQFAVHGSSLGADVAFMWHAIGRF